MSVNAGEQAHVYTQAELEHSLRCQSPPPLPPHLRQSVLIFAIAYGRIADLKTPWGFSCLSPAPPPPC